ncbi:hypothetical protein GGS20DRAFT_564987 [Poronia punctata]|nr:hypothetical protein GGS20DRAFT_564987 [Poronia punctata]
MDFNNNYNLDELDLALSEPRHQSASVAGPGPSTGGRRTAPGTRRGSVVPNIIDPIGLPGAGKGNKTKKKKKNKVLNLFTFGLKELTGEVLLKQGESSVSYHEYAVFDGGKGEEEMRSPSIMSDGEEGLRMARDALRNGFGLDTEGDFKANPKGRESLQGRVRQIIARRGTPNNEPGTGNGTGADGLDLTIEDYKTMGLHPATLPALLRVTTESSFWDAKRETFHLILSFSSNPQPPYDFLSMTYHIRSKTTTALIRRSFDTRWHDEDALDEYERRFDSCRSRWAHPLVLPIVLLQVQLLRTEEAVIANNGDVLFLEGRVDAVTGTTGRANAEAYKRNAAKRHNHNGNGGGGGGLSRPLTLNKRLSSLKEMVEEKVSRNSNKTATPPSSLYDPDYVPPQTIYLMKEAHDVLKGSIQLLDTLRWMERALKLLIQTGDELDARIRELDGKKEKEAEDDDDDDDDDWQEIRQYLDCIWRLCTSLETDRRMSELRCRAQIDIIYSKMAQEDNNLNARMAVASTRDSSSMKALAVITAIFLPGEYIGTLFGVSMFNWEKGTAGDPAASKDAADGLPSPTIMPSFWIYWAFTIPLTLVILSAWRGWWVNQDRYFRRHLSHELSNEKYWTTDGRPRDLETSFTQDFFSLFSISGARSTLNSTVLGNRYKKGNKSDLNDNNSSSSQGQGQGMSRQQSYPFSQSAASGSGSAGRDREWVQEERSGKGGRFRQISFAAVPRQNPPVSVV